MTLALWTPPLPALPLPQCSDLERKITRKCWDLNGVQAALNANVLRVVLSPSAAATMYSELAWNHDDLLAFVQCLSHVRYVDSEWGLPSGHGGRVSPLAADAYCMGFNRIKGEENQRTSPWVYFKFAVRPQVNALLVLSAHPVRDR